MPITSSTLPNATARKGNRTMDTEAYEQEVQKAADNNDLSRMRELERMEAEGRVGADEQGPMTAEEAYQREVDRAVRSGDKKRLDELEKFEANDEIEKAARTSGKMETRLDAAINEAEEAGDSDFAKQLRSIQEAPDPSGALQSAKKAATGDRYERLNDLAGE